MAKQKPFNESHPDWDRFHHLAKYGHSGFQYFLAAQIIGSNDYPNRRVEAYKWASLAVLLGESFAEEIPNFLRLSMSEQEIKLADQLVEDWFEKAIKSIQSEEGHYEGWSAMVLRIFKESAGARVDSNKSESSSCL